MLYVCVAQKPLGELIARLGHFRNVDVYAVIMYRVNSS